MKTPNQTAATFADISELIRQHLIERDWQDNPSRSLAISIILEATELLEHYQWHDEPIGELNELAEELADIFIYGFEFAIKNDIDIAAAIRAKLAKAAQKYPARQFRGQKRH
jgi:dCTP diphosphatase